MLWTSVDGDTLASGQRQRGPVCTGWRDRLPRRADTRLLSDGTLRWTSPGGGTDDRPPRRTVPPPLDRQTLPALA